MRGSKYEENRIVFSDNAVTAGDGVDASSGSGGGRLDGSLGVRNGAGEVASKYADLLKISTYLNPA